MTAKTAKQQFLVIASAALFFGSTAAAAIQFVTQMANESAPVADDRQMQQQAQGYEAILQREPNNQAALEGLMRSRMALGDFQGATEPLTRLIELHPQRQDYANQMRRLNAQQAGIPAGGINPFAGSAPIELKSN